jgi:hypothetical protein
MKLLQSIILLENEMNHQSQTMSASQYSTAPLGSKFFFYTKNRFFLFIFLLFNVAYYLFVLFILYIYIFYLHVF